MKKIKMKKKKVSDKKATGPRNKLDDLISQEKFQKKIEERFKEMDNRIKKVELAIKELKVEPKQFDPIVTATPINPDKSIIDRYDTACNEIDKKLNIKEARSEQSLSKL